MKLVCCRSCFWNFYLQCGSTQNVLRRVQILFRTGLYMGHPAAGAPPPSFAALCCQVPRFPRASNAVPQLSPRGEARLHVRDDESLSSTPSQLPTFFLFYPFLSTWSSTCSAFATFVDFSQGSSFFWYSLV